MYSTVWRNGGGWINCCKQTRFPINFNSFASRLLPGVLFAPGKKGNLRAGIIPPHLWRPIALTARSTAQYCTCTSARFFNFSWPAQAKGEWERGETLFFQSSISPSSMGEEGRAKKRLLRPLWTERKRQAQSRKYQR